MLYICTNTYLNIQEGDIVQVELGAQVRITHDKHTTCTDEFILNLHFKPIT